MYMIASCTSTASNKRPRRSVRISPKTCSQSGFRLWLSASIGLDKSESVHATWRFRYSALFPAPAPSSKRAVSGPCTAE